jgi:hypothetical protein
MRAKIPALKSKIGRKILIVSYLRPDNLSKTA